MKKLYNEFFYIPKHGKIQEKVMTMRVARTVVIMLVCLVAMSITAYAYFSHNVTSSSSVIKAANFEADVSITITSSQDETVPVTEVNGATHTAELQADTLYTVTLTKGAGSTAQTGFCIVTAEGSTDTYYTQQIGADATAEGGKREAVTFDIKVTKDTTITVLSHWGTSSHYAAYSESGSDEHYITNANTGDKAIVIKVTAGTTSSSTAEDKVTTSTEATTPAATKPTTTTGATTTPETTTTGATTTVPETTTSSTATATETTATETATSTEETQPTTPAETTVTEPVESTTGATTTTAESTTSTEGVTTTTEAPAETEGAQATTAPTSEAAV